MWYFTGLAWLWMVITRSPTSCCVLTFHVSGEYRQGERAEYGNAGIAEDRTHGKP